MMLDRSRPYGEVWGGAGHSAYEQDGLLFSISGELLPGQDETAAVPPPKRRGRPPKAPPSVEGPDYEAMSDDELRVLVETRGDEWEGREAAIEMLGGE